MIGDCAARDDNMPHFDLVLLYLGQKFSCGLIIAKR